jgi:methyltransferase (TIGR00027 family)
MPSPVREGLAGCLAVRAIASAARGAPWVLLPAIGTRKRRSPLWQAHHVIAGQQSRTAQYAAFFRALESRRPARQRLFDDPLAVAFLDRSLRAAVVAAGLPALGRALPWMLDRWIPGPRPSAVVRTRLIDDAVRSAVAAGVQQVVILGAGFDTRAYRMPELRRLAVFEVDHPDTQAVKLHVLEGELETRPDLVTLVPVDFDRDHLATALADAGLQPGLATFIIWEGVASYLTPQAVDATVRWAHSVSGRGSHLVLTYVDRGLVDGTRQFPDAGAWVRSVARAGEPFVFGFEPADLPRYLTERGWDLVADLSTTEALVQYGLSARRVPSFYRIAHATS